MIKFSHHFLNIIGAMGIETQAYGPVGLNGFRGKILIPTSLYSRERDSGRNKEGLLKTIVT
jgi:hypothetical protein